MPALNVIQKRHAAPIAFFVSTIICECLMNPLFVISCFALLGKATDAGWFNTAITLISVLSLALSQRIRMPGRRWVVFAGAIIGLGLGFAFFTAFFGTWSLIAAGILFAILRTNYAASWFAIASQTMEREWGYLGKNQALIAGEIFTVTARFCAAGLLLTCGLLHFSLRESLPIIVITYILSACISSLLARQMDSKRV